MKVMRALILLLIAFAVALGPHGGHAAPHSVQAGEASAHHAATAHGHHHHDAGHSAEAGTGAGEPAEAAHEVPGCCVAAGGHCFTAAAPCAAPGLRAPPGRLAFGTAGAPLPGGLAPPLETPPPRS